MDINLYKKSLLFRKAQGNLHRESYYKKISYFLGGNIENDCFIDLKETDAIVDDLKKSKEYKKETIAVGSERELIDFVVQKVSNKKFYILMDEEWKYCGAYKVECYVSFNPSFNFDICVSDEIRIISMDFRFQIQIDYSDGEINCLYVEYVDNNLFKNDL